MFFAKAHAYGNDFLYVRSSDASGTDPAALAREMCHRHTGIGADGLILYGSVGDQVVMRLFNADGGRAEVSGNGLRALAALVLRDDDRPHAHIDVQTDAGPKRLERLSRDGVRQTFRAAMGVPADVQKLLPIEVAGEAVQCAVVNLGNPHCVLLGPLPDDRRFRRLGEALEKHEMFPSRTNVEFVDVEAADRLHILIWERGVGPTSSSGTGSCASLVAAAAFGGALRAADVVAPGGTQHVEWNADGVYLTGWAELVCEGEWLRRFPPTT
jgi:diaminopimelate epimerase